MHSGVGLVSRLPSINLPAPSGMDVTSDPVQTPIFRAQLIVNLQTNYRGKLRNRAHLTNVLPHVMANPINGLAYYYQASLTNVLPTGSPPNLQDILLFFSGEVLYYSVPSANPFTTVFSESIAVAGSNLGNSYFAGGVFIGKHIRSAALGDELIFVQEGGVQPQRFYASPAYPGPHYWQAGILAPPLPTATAAAGPGITGTYEYKVTYYDERGRESSPSPVSSDLVLANQTGHVVIAWNADFPHNGFDGQVQGAYVYRNTTGGSVWYRVGNVPANRVVNHGLPYTLTVGDWILHLGDANDKATDAEIQMQAICPNPGENDLPNPASVIAVHKNHIFLNDVTNNEILQISNLLTPTQYTSLQASPQIATNGLRMKVATDQGDPMNALIEFGDVLGIFKRRGVWFLWGDSIADFTSRPIHQRGCISPDSAVRCDNQIWYLSDDGVYAASYQGGEIAVKTSQEIEKWLLMFTQQQREDSIGWYRDHRYHLAVDSVIFVYDFTSEGWSCYLFGMGEFDLGIPGFPPLLLIPPDQSGGTGGSITLPGGGSPPNTGSGSPPSQGGGSGGSGSGSGPGGPTPVGPNGGSGGGSGPM